MSGGRERVPFGRMSAWPYGIGVGDRVSVSLLAGKVHLCHVASGQQIDYSTFAPWRQKFILIANISILSVKNSYGLATGQQFDLWRQEFMNFENQQFNP